MAQEADGKGGEETRGEEEIRDGDCRKEERDNKGKARDNLWKQGRRSCSIIPPPDLSYPVPACPPLILTFTVGPGVWMVNIRGQSLTRCADERQRRFGWRVKGGVE
eukprot:760244-Hanusia_phi.AAC.1